MVTAENEEVFGIFDLVRKQQADGLEGLLATVHIVTKEEVVCLGRETTVLEKTQKIVVLTVDITANLHRNNQPLTSSPAKRQTYLNGRFEFEQNRL